MFLSSFPVIWRKYYKPKYSKVNKSIHLVPDHSTREPPIQVLYRGTLSRSNMTHLHCNRPKPSARSPCTGFFHMIIRVVPGYFRVSHLLHRCRAISRKLISYILIWMYATSYQAIFANFCRIAMSIYGSFYAAVDI